MNDIKRAALDDYVNSTLTLDAIAAKHGTRPTTVSMWAQKEGIPRRRPTPTVATKAAFMRDLPGWPGHPDELAAKHGVSVNTGYNWRKQYDRQVAAEERLGEPLTDEDLTYGGKWVRVGLILKPAAA